MKIKKIFLYGLKKLFPLTQNIIYGKTVAQSLQSDWYKIGEDFNKVLRNYGRN